MSDLRHIAFCGGGSGGHLFPVIAVAERLLQQPNFAATFVTSSRKIDASVLANAELPEDVVRIVVQPMSSSVGRRRMLWATWKSVLLCRRQFLFDRPDVVVGTGGFASVAGVLTAWWLKIPVVLLECNAIPGRANRLLSRFAAVTAAGWPISDNDLRSWKCNVHQTGVPVRPQFVATKHRSDGQLMVVVLGGSQGAARLNHILLDALAALDCGHRIEILHQTGSAHLSSVQQRYRDINVDFVVSPFIDDVASAITRADVVISRAGAVTLAEISAIGRPAILIPLSTAADDHQTANADCLCNAGAAVRIDEQSPDAAAQLCRQLEDLLCSSEKRNKMSVASAAISNSNATQNFIAMLRTCFTNWR